MGISMPFESNGTFVPAVSFNPGTPATAQDQNSQDLDIALGLTQCQTLAGLSAATKNWNQGGFKITNMGVGSASTDSITFGQVYGASGVIPTGTKTLFAQAAAPVGWTQVTSNNDTALRVVSGAGGTVHGTVGLSAFISAGALAHALTLTEVPTGQFTLNDPGHTHTIHSSNGDDPVTFGPGSNSFNSGGTAGTTTLTNLSATTGITLTDHAGGGSHTHALSDLQYLDLIVCSKN